MKGLRRTGGHHIIPYLLHLAESLLGEVISFNALEHETFILERQLPAIDECGRMLRKMAKQSGDAEMMRLYGGGPDDAPYVWRAVKTAGKSYDMLVTALRAVATSVAPSAIHVHSDGMRGDWEPGVAFARSALLAHDIVVENPISE